MHVLVSGSQRIWAESRQIILQSQDDEVARIHSKSG